jgi:hypothetical protein
MSELSDNAIDVELNNHGVIMTVKHIDKIANRQQMLFALPPQPMIEPKSHATSRIDFCRSTLSVPRLTHMSKSGRAATLD